MDEARHGARKLGDSFYPYNLDSGDFRLASAEGIADLGVAKNGAVYNEYHLS